MRYLYGDSTPFPLDENFIDTLRDLIQAGVDVLVAQESIDHSHHVRETIDKTEQAESDHIDRIAAALADTLAPHIGGATGSSGSKVAERVLESANKLLEESSAHNAERAVRGRQEVDAALAGARHNVHEALERFFARRQLPNMVWSVTWRATPGEALDAQVSGVSEVGLGVALSVDVPADHILRAPVRLGELAKGFTVHVPDKGGLFRRANVRAKNLDSFFLTGFENSRQHSVAIVCKSGKARSPGFRFLFNGEAESAGVTAIDDAGVDDGEGLALTGADYEALAQLVKRVERQTKVLVGQRDTLLAAELDGAPVIRLERPGDVVEKMIEAVAPLVREIRKRGSTRGELVLKMDLGESRRQEIFVPRQELAAEVSKLQAKNQLVFGPFALTKPTVELDASVAAEAEAELLQMAEADLLDTTQFDTTQLDTARHEPTPGPEKDPFGQPTVPNYRPPKK